MADSDDEYVQDLSDDAGNDGPSTSTGHRTRSTVTKSRQTGAQPGRTRERWEDIQRSWDLVTEGADGSLAASVEGLLEAGKRKRLLQDTTPVQRGIIRHMIVILDMSLAMSEKDLRPSRYLLALRYAQEFVRDFFEQNPISQIGLLGMRDGVAVRISELSGNPSDHITALQAIRQQEPKGNPSLQNALEMARAALFHTPTHGTREVVIIFGALQSSDPGDIHKTINALVADKIRVSVVGLAARMAICTEMCTKTNGISLEANPYLYGVAMNEQHFRELLFWQITPPVMRSTDQSSAPSLMVMGFPSRIEENEPTLCACHGNPTRGGFLCSRCKAKVCNLPTQCPTCDLQLIQSTHLARSYRHLFRLSNWSEVSWREARRKGSVQCFGCLQSFPPVPAEGEEALVKRAQKGASESSRYRCTACGEHFCVDCDVYAHETLNSCAGCLSKPQKQRSNGLDHGTNGVPTQPNGHDQTMDTT